VKIKDKRIKIYYEVQRGQLKRYIHPPSEYLKAYVRQLSAYEQNMDDAIQDGSEIEFVINPRQVSVDMYIEFLGDTYQITSVDRYEFYTNNELKIRARKVSPKEYVAIDGDW